VHVISASRRTDIPAFYSRWLLNRLRAGCCHWVNPFGGQVYRVSLQPEDCLAVVFWTRNFAPLLPHIKALHTAGYRFYVHYTLTGYPKVLESHAPPVSDAIAVMQQLAEEITSDFVLWRYDPIILSNLTPVPYHLEQFHTLCEKLSGATRRCYFSFAQLYGKTERHLTRLRDEEGFTYHEPTLDERHMLVAALRDIAAPHGITLYACCGDALIGEGVEKAHCVDADLIHRLRPDRDFSLRKAPTRKECGCYRTVDIGAYDTCAFGCAYCYATNSRDIGLARLQEHDPDDSLLYRPPALEGVDLPE